MLQPITYQKIYNQNGDFTHLRLLQGGNYIDLSLSGKGTHPTGYRWQEIKERVEKLSDEVKQESQTLGFFDVTEEKQLDGTIKYTSKIK